MQTTMLKPTFNNYIDVTTLDKNRPRTVVFYGRVSTEHEAQLSALENQIQWYEETASHYPNWTVIDKYIDEGITGTQAKKRPAFLKMIEDAKSGKFDLIVTREVCRFARNTVDTLNYTRQLRNLGVEVFFVGDSIRTFDNDGELKLSLMATFAQEESRKVSERVKAGQKISRENKTLYGNGNILGYDLDKEHNTYVINPEQAETVRMAFEMYAEGTGDSKIAKEMCRLHRKAADGTVNWNAGKISRIIKNATYKGYICYNKSRSNNYLDQRRINNNDESTHILVKGDFEPIVSEELWDKCDTIRRTKVRYFTKNGQLEKRGKNPSSDVWLHKLRCKCGAAFRKNKWRRNKSGEEVFGYQCYHQLNHGSKSFREKNGLDTDGYCDIRMVGDWKLDLMAKAVMTELWKNSREDILQLCEYIQRYGVEEEINIPKENSEFNSAVTKLKTRLENLTEMRADGELTKEEYTAAKLKTEAEIAKLNEQNIIVPKAKKTAVNIDIEEIKIRLIEMSEFLKGELTDEFLEEAISGVNVMDNNRFEWTIRISGKESVSAMLNIGGRKNNPSVKIEGISPLTYDIVVFDTTAIKNTYQINELHRRLSEVNRSSPENLLEPHEIAVSWEFTIDFETAKAYRKSQGLYVRPTQWKDITAEVVVS